LSLQSSLTLTTALLEHNVLLPVKFVGLTLTEVSWFVASVSTSLLYLYRFYCLLFCLQILSPREICHVILGVTVVDLRFGQVQATVGSILSSFCLVHLFRGTTAL